MKFKLLYEGNEIVITLDSGSMYGSESYLLHALADYIYWNAEQEGISETISCGQRFIVGEIDKNKITYLGSVINDLSIL